ncbi:hypothetical protein LCU01_14990 [Latilactobacillus curvatus]|uniref:ABC transporter permease n=1 Tax=Latilactobacillus curvatus JCM 1096 = DSM 20019 TaxID=1293592 RepID=A0AAJ0LEV3_LATCU|nr:hypothetical protein FC08_GL000691 [Latilactobacillus curvatus JCM 1096 = DSM 20019]GED82591.1 hypothetical protein LCU01_14990 [Latilactobacillus curvatus]
MKTFAIAKRVLTELSRDKRTLALMFVAPILIILLYKFNFFSEFNDEHQDGHCCSADGT